MPYSILTYDGDGSSVTFPIPFTLGELRLEYVQCQVDNEVDGLGNPIYRSLSYAPGAPGSVIISGTPPLVGVDNVVFRRIMPKDMLLNDYTNGRILDEETLNESFLQVLMALHEVLDGVGLTDVHVDINMHGHKLTNIYSDPEDPDSVATVAFLGSYRTDAEAAAAAAAASAADAQQNADLVESLAGEAGATFVRPEQYGADPLGVLDSSAAMTQAIQAAHDTRKPLMLYGRYRLNTPVVLTGLTNPVSLVGNGRGISEFLCYGDGGISLTFSDRHATVDIGNLTFLAMKAGAGTAFAVTFVSDTSWAQRHVVVKNVDIVGGDYNAQTADVWYFDDGIVLDDCWNSFIDTVNVIGETNTLNMHSCIWFKGQSIASTIHKADLYYSMYGVLIEGELEGFRLQDGCTVGCGWGVYHNTPGGEPEFKVTNSHLNNFLGGLYVRNCMRVCITGNFFKCLDPAAFGLTPITEYADIVLNGVSAAASQDSTIHSNCINTPQSYTTTGIVLGTNTSSVRVYDNIIRDRSVGVHVQADAGAVMYIKDNTNLATVPFLKEGGTNVYYSSDQPLWGGGRRSTTIATASIGSDGYIIPLNQSFGNHAPWFNVATDNTRIVQDGLATLCRVEAQVAFIPSADMSVAVLEIETDDSQSFLVPSVALYSLVAGNMYTMHCSIPVVGTPAGTTFRIKLVGPGTAVTCAIQAVRTWLIATQLA